MYSLYIGRFQPFHLGHLDAIKQCLQLTKKLIIGVGSADDNWLPENPFTCGERIEMIKNSLDQAGISSESYLIIPIWNINNYAIWPEHVKNLLPKFDTIYTASEVVSELFKNYSDIKVTMLSINIDVSATQIRDFLFKENNEKLKELLPSATLDILNKINGAKRLHTIKDLVRK